MGLSASFEALMLENVTPKSNQLLEIYFRHFPCFKGIAFLGTDKVFTLVYPSTVTLKTEKVFMNLCSDLENVKFFMKKGYRIKCVPT